MGGGRRPGARGRGVRVKPARPSGVVRIMGRNEAGQSLEQFEGCEAKLLATAQIGLRKPVDQAGLR